MDGASPEEYLKWEDLVYLTDLAEEAGLKELRFLGGEPTLHPAFSDFAAYALSRKFAVVGFTSGIMSDKVMGEIKSVYRSFPEADGRFSFLCNINDPAKTPPAELSRVEEFLSEFGPMSPPASTSTKPILT